MSQAPSPLARFTVKDERARIAVQMLSQTAMAAIVWAVAWRWVAPLLGVQVLNLTEFVQSLVSVTLAMTLSGVEPSQSLVEIAAGFFLWMLPVFVILCGAATISAALWYLVGRLIEPSAAPDAGGDA